MKKAECTDSNALNSSKYSMYKPGGSVITERLHIEVEQDLKKNK